MAITTDAVTPETPASDNMMSSSVPARHVVAVSLITLSWLVMLAILVMACFQIQRFELAPGEAMPVSPRISFVKSANGATPPTRYASKNSIRFVTAYGGQLSVLDSVLGWIDPHVQVDTYAEHFGTQSPSAERVTGFQAMYGAKQVAEYVAMKKLGLDAQFLDGPIVVDQLVCLPNPTPNSACKNLKVGDTIVALNGVTVNTLKDLSAQMVGHKAGDKVTLSVVHYKQKATDVQKVNVTLMANPDDATKFIIGFMPADTRQVKLPFDVNITTTDIGGPSAGLAFTLALLDDLTPGNLMGRGRVAATGTINEDGTVGAIGALEQKAVAVKNAGATLFLVPKGQSDKEVAKARAAAGSGVTIVQVGTVDEALAQLVKNGGGSLTQ
jgi:PDZ domain-containing protein